MKAAVEGNLCQFRQRVKLNVGGIKFETTLSTLTRYPESMLGAMFSGRHDMPADDDGYVFIDCDGTHFRIILNFMRTGSLDGPVSPTAASELKRELEYYQLPVPFASQTLPKTVAIHTQRRPTPPAQSRPQRTYKPQKEKPEGCVELFIGNLPWSIDDDKITNFFKSAGTVTSVRWLNDRETQEFKGVGFVTFSSTEEVDKAVELAGESIDGRQIRIDYAGQKKEGNGGGNTWQTTW